MYRKIVKFVFILFLSIIFSALSAFAQHNAKGQNKNTPPGWEKGEKKGWQSDVPPGQEKRDKKREQRRFRHEKRAGKKSKANLNQDGEENDIETEPGTRNQEIEDETGMKAKDAELNKEDRTPKLKSKKQKSKSQSKVKKSE